MSLLNEELKTVANLLFSVLPMNRRKELYNRVKNNPAINYPNDSVFSTVFDPYSITGRGFILGTSDYPTQISQHSSLSQMIENCNIDISLQNILYKVYINEISSMDISLTDNQESDRHDEVEQKLNEIRLPNKKTSENSINSIMDITSVPSQRISENTENNIMDITSDLSDPNVPSQRITENTKNKEKNIMDITSDPSEIISENKEKNILDITNVPNQKITENTKKNIMDITSDPSEIISENTKKTIIDIYYGGDFKKKYLKYKLKYLNYKSKNN